MRRTLTLVLAAALSLGAVGVQAQTLARLERKAGLHLTERNERRLKECRFRHFEKPYRSFSDREIKITVRCAVAHWSVPGGIDKALQVGHCESGYNEHAANPYSSASGVFQFISSTWDSVLRRWREFRRRWDVGTGVFNGRNNVLLAIRLAHTKAGWGPWSCG